HRAADRAGGDVLGVADEPARRPPLGARRVRRVRPRPRLHAGRRHGDQGRAPLDCATVRVLAAVGIRQAVLRGAGGVAVRPAQAHPEIPRQWIAILLLFGIVGLLIKQPDLGMAVVVTAVFFIQFFLAGLNLFWVVAFVMAGGGAMVGAYVALPHVTSRVDRFLDPTASNSYQIHRAMDAFMN